MRVVLRYPMKTADLEIPSGDYFVGVTGEVVTMAGRGNDYKIPAKRRSSQRTFRISQVQFQPSGGNNWTLIFSVPPKTEYVVFFIKAEEK